MFIVWQTAEARNERLAGRSETTSVQVTNAEFTRALGRALHRPAVMAVPGKLIEAGFRFEQPAVDEALGAVVGTRG